MEQTLHQRILQGKQNNSYNYRLVSQIDCSKENDETISSKMGNLLPVKLVNSSQPIFQMPEQVKVIITNGSKNAEPSVIPYQSSQQQQAKHVQIPIEEFTTYDGPLALSIAQMPLQSQSYFLPTFVQSFFTSVSRGKKTNNIHKVNLWHYLGDRISKWHYDGHDNILFMLKGRKLFYLVEQSRGRGRSVFDIDSNHGLKDNFEEFVTDQKDIWKCEVKEGEAIFIPRGWWHYVQSYGETQAINIWGNSFTQIDETNQSEALLKHLIFQLSENECQKFKDWDNLDEDIKKKYRRTAFQILFSRKMA